MLASIPPLDQVNALIDFDNHFKISSISMSFCQHFKKRYEKTLNFQPSCWRGRLCFMGSKVTLSTPPPPQKNPGLALVLFKSMWCDRQKSVINLYLGCWEVLWNGCTEADLGLLQHPRWSSPRNASWCRHWKGTVCFRLLSQNYDESRGLF